MNCKRTFLKAVFNALVLSVLVGIWLSSRLITVDSINLLMKAIVLLSASWLIISACHHLSKKTWFRAFSLFILVSAGVVIYGSRETQGMTTGTLMEETEKLFDIINKIMSALFHVKGGEDSASETLLHNLFHLLVYLYAAMLGFSIWGRRVTNRSNIWLFFSRKKNLIWGYSPAGMILAKDILKNTLFQQVIFVLPAESQKAEKHDPLFEEIDKIGGIVFYKDFKKLKFIRAHRHFFLTEDQNLNVEMAMQLLQTMGSQKNKRRKIHLYIRTEADRIDNFFTNREGIELHLFNQSDLTACNFVKNHPMLDCPGITIDKDALKVKGNFNLLLLGFGWTGQELLKKCICDSQFVGSMFNLTIIEKDYEKKYGYYPVLFDEAIREYNMVFNPENINDVGSHSFYKWLKSKNSSFNRIIVALGDDALNVETGLTIVRLLQINGVTIEECRKRIFVHVRQKTKFACYENEESPITLFGDLEKIYTQEVIIDETTDKIAKMVNYVYELSSQPKVDKIDMQDAETRWIPISLFFKDSSRAVAANVLNICRIAGDDIGNLRAEQLEVLAENEHLRWNAFHFVNGIRTWKLNEINTDNAKCRDKNGNLLKHGCLDTFAELNKISAKVNEIRVQKGTIQNKGEEDYAESDRRIVRHFPLFSAEISDKKTKI